MTAPAEIQALADELAGVGMGTLANRVRAGIFLTEDGRLLRRKLAKEMRPLSFTHPPTLQLLRRVERGEFDPPRQPVTEQPASLAWGDSPEGRGVLL